jgi:hypothetical protein
MTGMSHCFHDADSGHYCNYPTAFGDTLTGTNLVGPICMALAQRVQSGRCRLYILLEKILVDALCL